MNDDGRLIAEGIVRDSSHGHYVVDCNIGGFSHLVTARLAGRLHCHKIRVIVGDRVRVELSAHDPSRGRIISRERLAA